MTLHTERKVPGRNIIVKIVMAFMDELSLDTTRLVVSKLGRTVMKVNKSAALQVNTEQHLCYLSFDLLL
jgi:hypothetical protein